jgi:uncharacterized membrane protein YdjX (TVP38/TMEM64 family)
MMNYRNLNIEKTSNATFSIDEEQGVKIFDFKRPEVKPVPSQGRMSPKTVVLLTIALTAIVAVYLFCIRTGMVKELASNLQSILKEEYEANTIRFGVTVYFAMVTIVVTCLGIHSLFCVIVASIIENFYIVFPLLMLASISGDFCAYLIAKYTCKDWLYRKFKANEFFQLLVEESKNSPYKTAFMTRFIFIPAGAKNYILSLIDNPLPSYILSGLALHCLFVFESCLIANELSEVQHLMSKSQSWSDKSTIEKASFFVVLGFVVFTIVFVISLGIWATRKIKSKRKADETIMKDFNN